MSEESVLKDGLDEVKAVQTAAPIIDVLAKRWSPRAFLDKAVSAEVLRSLFEAARWSASSSNGQPWRFVVATREETEAHARIAVGLMDGNRVWASSAPVLLVVASSEFDYKGRPSSSHAYDTGMAVAQLVIQATAMGLSAHQMGGIHANILRESLEIPEGFQIHTAIALGYRGEVDGLPDALRDRERSPRSRKPLAEIAFTGRWGESFE